MSVTTLQGFLRAKWDKWDYISLATQYPSTFLIFINPNQSTNPNENKISSGELVPPSLSGHTDQGSDPWETDPHWLTWQICTYGLWIPWNPGILKVCSGFPWGRSRRCYLPFHHVGICPQGTEAMVEKAVWFGTSHTVFIVFYAAMNSRKIESPVTHQKNLGEALQNRDFISSQPLRNHLSSILCQETEVYIRCSCCTPRYPAVFRESTGSSFWVGSETPHGTLFLLQRKTNHGYPGWSIS